MSIHNVEVTDAVGMQHITNELCLYNHYIFSHTCVCNIHRSLYFLSPSYLFLCMFDVCCLWQNIYIKSHTL